MGIRHQFDRRAVAATTPWPARGRRLFESLNAIDIHRFEPKRFLHDRDVVVVLFDFDATVKATRASCD
jgi:hypothetical protein